MHIKEEEAEKMHSTSSIKESGSQSGRFLKAVQEVGRVAHQAPKSHRKKSNELQRFRPVSQVYSFLYIQLLDCEREHNRMLWPN